MNIIRWRSIHVSIILSCMMICSIPTFHFHPWSFKAYSHVEASPIATPFSNLTVLRERSSRDFGSLVRRSKDQTAVEAPSAAIELESAPNIVRKFYDGFNSRDLALVEDLIALNCVYEDLIFSKPFVGRKAIIDFFNQFIDTISSDLQFAIDDLSEEDTSVVGVIWHLEWKGKQFPFSRGCSFYRLDVVNGRRQIVFGRDAVEPAIKPGEAALVAIKGVTWLLQKFPFLADRL